jgi:hypothetical protein
MTRERSTWNIHQIAKQAGLKLADPYTMNQDHVNQQPAADEYVIGDPSTFAEDIHPSTTTWEAEYSGGQVKRNEIGMPEMRNDTFNHPEKTASEEVLTKKAALCVAIARSMLPKTASNLDIEEQSISLMHLPDAEVMSTYTRLAAKQDQDQQQQQVQAAKQDQDQQQQQVQAAQQQDQQGQQQQEQKQAAKQDQDQQQQVQAAVINDPRSTAVRALVGQQQDQQGQQEQEQKQAAQQQDQQGQQEQEQKQAGQEQQAQMQQQLAQMIQQAQQQLEQLQAQSQQQQAGQQQQQAGQQQQQAQMQQQSQAQQVAQAVQQAIQQGQDPVAAADACMAQYQQQQGGQQQQQGNEGELIDQMLAQQTQQQQPMANMDIQLDTPTMDVGEVQLGPEDDMLMQLFANEETQQAQQAQEGGQQQQKQAHAVRTASMRTVGTVPSQGVSRIGGGSTATAGATSSNLSSLWSSAPDVREAFGIPTNQ